MRLKATKTRMYNLVLAHYPDVPPMRQTEFVKAPRHRAWWLSFDTPCGYCKAYFSAVCGKALLSFLDGAPYNVVQIPLSELKRYDLLDFGGEG